VVTPIILAQLLRQVRPIGARADAHRHALSRLAQFGVLLMVFVGAVRCGEELQKASDPTLFSPIHLIAMIVAVIAIHGALLLISAGLCRILGIGRGDAIAVMFAGSQKTIMIGAYLAAAIGPLAILPMVAYHAAQLVVDTLVADWLRRP
jgi:sodium/bile acid cotransporter 7